jgi:hypothetical protein
MASTIRTVAIMVLAPPLLIYALMRAGAFASHGPVIGYGALVLPWAIAMAGLVTSGWQKKVQASVGVAYTLAAIPVLPFLALLAVCTTGDCL